MVRLLFFNDTATTEIYTLSLHDALPIFTAHTPVGRVDYVIASPGKHWVINSLGVLATVFAEIGRAHV